MFFHSNEQHQSIWYSKLCFIIMVTNFSIQSKSVVFPGKEWMGQKDFPVGKKKYQGILSSFQGNPSLSEKKKKSQCSPKCLFFAGHLLAEEKELGFFFFFPCEKYPYSYKVWNLRVVQEKMLVYAVFLFSSIRYFNICAGSMKAVQLRICFQLWK